MAYEYQGNIVPAPGLTPESKTTVDQELKYSSVGFSQKGGTLAGGQGVLLLGTVLALDTSTHQWVKFQSGGANGAGVAAGVLRKTTDTGAAGEGKFSVNIVFRGSLKYNLVSTANGSELAAATTSLGAKANTTLNIFSF